MDLGYHPLLDIIYFELKTLRKSLVEIIQQAWNKYQETAAIAVSALGVLVYGIKSWIFIHTLTSIVYDESGYIVRGFLLATGKYSPYADYGPLLDHMPLSFLIPGYIQKIFNPGIGTARYFMVSFSCHW